MIIKHNIEFDEKEFNIIPYSWNYTNVYSMVFSGWTVEKFDCFDPQLNALLDIGANAIKTFISSMKQTHAFTQPELSVNVYDQKVTIKIGTMPLELYEEMKEKNGKK